ncbi:hypothetical protein BZA05DRAFT_76725 [Tricharina praecox]|uniref:uncharacterized protein n=1 Tax=Tricharina praecox TaxID=43433 RepID=UPI00221EFF2C|nr:uncharacterized protein BZA05DRAFT_76725 [Tricharina praecox]KAI5849777.1 hypothetical protein BZA05DRAFT_76725 [Tricharina praecox]
MYSRFGCPQHPISSHPTYLKTKERKKERNDRDVMWRMSVISSRCPKRSRSLPPSLTPSLPSFLPSFLPCSLDMSSPESQARAAGVLELECVGWTRQDEARRTRIPVEDDWQVSRGSLVMIRFDASKRRKHLLTLLGSPEPLYVPRNRVEQSRASTQSGRSLGISTPPTPPSPFPPRSPQSPVITGRPKGLNRDRDRDLCAARSRSQ